MSDEDSDRPNPEELLRAVQRTEVKGGKGRLKIFLGMAAGVGKTYTMLEEAQKLANLGTQVVVGSVETHGRKETAKLLEGLKIVPERWIEYRGTPFKELDIDEILKQKPELVIVDELAHSNVPGSRHPKRWQDVEEILDRGINVFTTLNVQHIESLKDVVEQITDIPVTESVPDSIIEQATQIELIDLTPLELLERLKEGKVYLGAQAQIAIHHFFKEDRLTALREIALRFAAEKVDHDLRRMVSSVEREEAWKPRERLLALVTQNPRNQKTIRTTRRLAFVLNAPWIALHVDDGSEMTDEEKAVLTKNMDLARDLGAEVILTHDPYVEEAIKRIAKQWGVTQIIMSRRPEKVLFGLFPQSNLIEKVIENCTNLDVHVIRYTGASSRFKKARRYLPENWSPYLVVTILVGMLTAFNVFIHTWLGYREIGFNYMVGILLFSLFFRIGPILWGSILAALSWFCFFIYSFDVEKPALSEDWPLIILFLLTAFFIGLLTERARKSKEMLVKREETAEALYKTARDIATSTNQKQLLETLCKRVERLLGVECKIFLKGVEDDQLNLEKEENDPKEKAAIEWVFENGKEAGWSTNTLPLGKALYLPLKTSTDSYGVFGLTPLKGRALNLADKNFLLTVCQLLSNAIEKEFKVEQEKKEESIRQTEKVYQTVLEVLSEKFADPFHALRASVGELKKADIPLGERLIYRIDDTSEKLYRDIENISAMAKLNAGELLPVKVPNDVRKLLDACFNKIKKLVIKHRIKIDVPPDVPLVPFDFNLIQVCATNLIVNAIQNSPEGSCVEIRVQISKDQIFLSVLDEGEGIPEDMLETVFEKFTRLPDAKKAGLGLGLSIAKEIAALHSGDIRASNRATGGSDFTLSLPL